MASTLVGTIAVDIRLQLGDSTDVLGTKKFDVVKTYSWSIANGTGAGQANKLYLAQPTVTQGAGIDIDLNGTLTDPWGATFSLTKLKGLVIAAAAANTQTVLLSRPAATGAPLFAAAQDALVVNPGGVEAWWASDVNGIAVGAGASDLLHLTTGGAADCVVDLYVIGV